MIIQLANIRVLLLKIRFTRVLILPIPTDWKQANVVPIKKSDEHSAINYRHVSLTAICCKILEHILTSSMRTHLSQNNTLYDIVCMALSRIKRSCETQLVIRIQDLAKALSKDNQFDIIPFRFFEDICYKVPQQRLIHKLNYYIRN